MCFTNMLCLVNCKNCLPFSYMLDLHRTVWNHKPGPCRLVKGASKWLRLCLWKCIHFQLYLCPSISLPLSIFCSSQKTYYKNITVSRNFIPVITQNNWKCRLINRIYLYNEKIEVNLIFSVTVISPFPQSSPLQVFATVAGFTSRVRVSDCHSVDTLKMHL